MAVSFSDNFHVLFHVRHTILIIFHYCDVFMNFSYYLQRTFPRTFRAHHEHCRADLQRHFISCKRFLLTKNTKKYLTNIFENVFKFDDSTKN